MIFHDSDLDFILFIYAVHCIMLAVSIIHFILYICNDGNEYIVKRIERIYYCYYSIHRVWERKKKNVKSFSIFN